MEKLEEILNLLFLNLVNLIVCGDFNVNFMTDNIKKYQIISLLKMYNLDYKVNFPTRINDCTETTIDNIFLDRSKNENFIIELQDFSEAFMKEPQYEFRKGTVMHRFNVLP